MTSDRLAPEVAPASADTLEIIVSLDDIRLADRDSNMTCPFARALNRAGYVNAWVGYESVRPLGYYGKAFDHTPESAAWLRAFDESLPIAPARFVLHRRPRAH